MAPGEARALTVIADAPVAVKIECFVQQPPPPGLRPCSACGSFTIGTGESLPVVADQFMFRDRGGSLRIGIVDSTGDRRQLVITVSADTDNSSRSGSGALAAG